VQFDGVEDADGIIGEAVDEYTGLVDVTATVGNIRGYGLKLEGDDKHKAEVGLFFDDQHNPPIKVEVVAVNEPRTLKVAVPSTLLVDGEYYLKIVTQSTVKRGGGFAEKYPGSMVGLHSDHSGVDHDRNQAWITAGIRLRS
jgi:hypothetical protein